MDATLAMHEAEASVAQLALVVRTHGEVERAVKTVRVRYRECLETLRVMTASVQCAGDDAAAWQSAGVYKEATTSYKHDTSGRLWLKTEGLMEDVSMVEAVALWKEIDLFKSWFPLCASSSVLARQGRVELIASIELSAGTLPIGKRDAVLHGYGVDALDDGFMLIIGTMDCSGSRSETTALNHRPQPPPLTIVPSLASSPRRASPMHPS